jgi:hypothetical protein
LIRQAQGGIEMTTAQGDDFFCTALRNRRGDEFGFGHDE